MNFLYFLESIRNPVLNFLMGAITFIGGETLFLVIAILLIFVAPGRLVDLLVSTMAGL